MTSVTVEAKKLRGKLIAPADKSISHRVVVVSALAQGQTKVKNLSTCQDCLQTITAFKNMGITITRSRDGFIIQGKGLDGLHRPVKGELFLGNSGTSMRMISGVLSGAAFECKLSGDDSLSQRPMKRVIEPLTLMGAKISARMKDGQQFPPLVVRGGKLVPVHYTTTVASAQVKSAILLAGLYAEGQTQVTEPAQSRDHTERMLKRFGADISVHQLSVSVKGRANLSATTLTVPGDVSSASFFLVGACISKGSQVSVESVGLNPTRTAFLEILQKMGAKINIVYQNKASDYSDEASGKVSAESSHLKAISITPEQIPMLIDELPILMVAATVAEGETKISGAGELRMKETDRIKAMVTNLSRMGADIEAFNNDIVIRGPSRMTGSSVDSFLDHRIAMCMAIAGLAARGRTTIKNADCVNVSYPGFFKTLAQLTR